MGSGGSLTLAPVGHEAQTRVLAVAAQPSSSSVFHHGATVHEGGAGASPHHQHHQQQQMQETDSLSSAPPLQAAAPAASAAPAAAAATQAAATETASATAPTSATRVQSQQHHQHHRQQHLLLHLHHQQHHPLPHTLAARPSAPQSAARHHPRLRAPDRAHGPPPRLVLFMAGWFVTSLASLFCAKHILHNYPVNEAVFTLSQFASSVFIGLAFTKLLRLHPLASLSAVQLRAVLPLAAAFLVKEMLKYMAIARISVNLVNTVRSLGPLFSIAIERIALHHNPPRAVVLSIIPTILGVALTSYDEMNANSSAGLSFVIFLVGLSAAVVSTAINQSQNIYSKILFGQERIDPVSLQIYLSAMSLAIIAPYTIIHSLYEFTKMSASMPSRFTFAPPSWHVAGILFGAGFINFLSSQLAFSTLALISPVSYSVANTFKRVCIAVIAIAVFGEHLSPVNGIGIAVSIAGVFAYEKASRDYKQSKLYRSVPKSPNASDSALPDLHVSDNLEMRWTKGKDYSGVPSDPNSVIDVTSHHSGGLPHDRQSCFVPFHNQK